MVLSLLLIGKKGSASMETITFLQPCPVCGRKLIINREHAGREVVCHHCRASFCSREWKPQNTASQETSVSKSDNNGKTEKRCVLQ
ncbi:MAG: hypothetical protein LBU65_02020 [Planctomycetaceae bacterium]|nr:hypothetical protein [Planctomycetaceae bacterium]